MSTLILDKVLSGYNLAKVNDNFERIEKAFNEALLHRDGSKELTDDLDVNNQKLLNVRGIEIDGVDITESVNQLREEYASLIDGIQEYQSILDGILAEAISYGAVDKKSIGNAQTTFTTTQNYAVNATLTLPLPYIVGKNTLRLNQNHYYEFFKDVDYEEVGTFNTQSTTIKLLKPVSTGVVFEQFVDGDNDLYSIYSTAEALQTLLTESYPADSIEDFINAVADVEELGLEDKIAELNSLYENLSPMQTALATTVADINTKYSTITDMYEDMGTKYSLLETIYPQLLNLISDTDFDLDDLNTAIGALNDDVADINSAIETVEGYKDAASDSATEAAGSASDAADSALEAASYVSTINTSVNNARIWAEGTDTEVATLSGTHSAKEWAEQAESVQNAVKYTSQSLTTAQKEQARTNIGAFNVGEGITATGSTTARTLASRFADIINVKDFGAKGDGTTDDTDAIQAAITAADGRIVFFPIGVYLVNGGLTVSDSCEITGYGATIKQMTAGTVKTITVQAADVTIRNMNFANNAKLIDDDNRACDYCISTTNAAHNLTISGCSFDNFRGCIFPTTGNDGLIKNLTIENCRFNRYDFAMLLDDFDGCSIANCEGRNVTAQTGSGVDWDPPHLLYVTDRSGTRKRNLRVVNCLEVGNVYSEAFKVRNTDGVTISNCIADGCCRGIVLDQCWNATVTNNVVANMVTTSTEVTGSADNQQSGIWLSDVSGGVVSGNYVDCSASGLTAMGFRIIRQSASTELVDSENLLVDGNCIVTNLNAIAVNCALVKNSVIRNNSIIVTDDTKTTFMYRLDGCDGVTVENGAIRGTVQTPRLIKFNDGTWDGTAVLSKNNIAVTNGHLIQDGYNPIVQLNGTGTTADVEHGTAIIPNKRNNTYPAFRNQDYPKAGIASNSGGLIYTVQKSASDGQQNVLAMNWRAVNAAPWLYVYGGISPYTDNNVPLGTSALRWSEVFAGTGTINTSDERMKSNIRGINDDVLDAWGDVSFQVFQFKDALEAKGENARLHTGVIAQQVKEAFEARGLDAFRFGLLCYDEWDDEWEEVEVTDKEEVLDEDGAVVEPAVTHKEMRKQTEAGNAYGIRYDEALAIEAAYQRRRADRIEARLNAIEEKIG